MQQVVFYFTTMKRTQRSANTGSNHSETKNRCEFPASDFLLYASFTLASSLERPQASNTLKAGHRQISQTDRDERRLKALGWILQQINSHKLTAHW